MADNHNHDIEAAAAATEGPSVKKRSRSNNNNNNNTDDIPRSSFHRNDDNTSRSEQVHKEVKIATTTATTTSTSNEDDDVLEQEKNNPLYLEQYNFLQSLSDIERNYFFSNGSVSGSSNTSSNTSTSPDDTDTTNETTTCVNYSISAQRRSEIWDLQSQIGTRCINQYAWVTPNQQCLHILAHFTPLIEIGCGTNAYWCRQLLLFLSSSRIPPKHATLPQNDMMHVVVGYDISLTHGGKIKDAVEEGTDDDTTHMNPVRTPHYDWEKIPFQVLFGGPEVLALPEHSNRTLFLCYPDENEDDRPHATKIPTMTTTTTTTATLPKEAANDDDEEDDEEEEPKEQYSMAYECMKYFTGDTLIHVGELMHVTSPIIGNDTAPYGRTSAAPFQEYLFTHFHCVLQYPLPLHWLHTNNDALTVWKRSSNVTTIAYSNDNDDNDNDDKEDEDEDDDEEVQYRHIPMEERLPVMNIAAPCVQHLWL